MRWHQYFNFPAFDTAAEILIAQGHEVFSPAARDREKEGFDPVAMNMQGTPEELVDLGFDLRKALACDTSYICLEADRIHMLAGWARSTGATAERALAITLGLEITGAPA